ncbi:MAG: hypothetical protein ACJ8GO_02465 [Ramlibacter sp.]
MNSPTLQQENVAYAGSGGTSAGNRSLGFRPAFRNLETGIVYLSRFADGRPAPIHMVDGLPDELVVARSASGKVRAVSESVQSGFLLDGCFYDRQEAAEYAAVVGLSATANPKPVMAA